MNSGERKHDPAEKDGDADEGDENLDPVDYLFPQGLLGENGKHYGHKE